MKTFWDVCKNSFQLPKKQAVFALNRIGMDVTVVYLFILLAIASIPELVTQINDSSTHLPVFFFLIYFFIFYYLVLTVIFFSFVSFLAYIASIVAKGLKRKLHYSILWKMLAFSSTIPLFVFTCISFFYPLSLLFFSLSVMFVFYIIVKVILIYPKRTA